MTARIEGGPGDAAVLVLDTPEVQKMIFSESDRQKAVFALWRGGRVECRLGSSEKRYHKRY
jgi:hypothetical protein